MESLIRLVKSLKPKEITIIEGLYSAKSHNDGNACKKLKLLKLILDNKICTNKDAADLLCHHNHRSIISQLKKRLEEDILNVFSISSFSEIKEVAVKAELNCYKSLLLGKVLIARGLMEEGLNILEKTADTASKSELHQVELSCNDILRAYRSSKILGKQGQVYNEKITHSLENFKNILYAKSINYSFFQAKSFFYAPFSTGLNLRNLVEKSRECSCSKAVHWYTMAIIHYYIQERDFNNAKNATLSLVKKVKLDCPAGSGYEAIEFYLQLARILIYLREFKESEWAAETAFKNAIENKFKILPTMEALFLAYFRNNKWSKAEEIIILADKQIFKPEDGATGVWHLFNAGLQFAQQKFKESNHWLLTGNLLNDGTHLNLSAKLFELLNILELEDYDWFEYKIQAYRKRLERFGIQKIQRIKMLYDLLCTLRRTTYNYKETIRLEEPKIAILQSDHKCLGWDPLGFELIDTSQWLLSKGLPNVNTLIPFFKA